MKFLNTTADIYRKLEKTFYRTRYDSLNLQINMVCRCLCCHILTFNFIVRTRMHSSRIRTVHCSSRVPSPGGSTQKANTPSPWTESQTLGKTLPCHNYVADGDKFLRITKFQIYIVEHRKKHSVTAPDRCYCLNQASLTRDKGRAGEFPVGEDQ